jgi:hypothetical protein
MNKEATTMKKTWGTFLIASVLVLSAAILIFAQDDNGPNGPKAEATPSDITLANASHGVIFGEAAINADGTVASCFNCNKSTTMQIKAGAYQVGFQGFGQGQIQATNGFSRWVQVDALGTGSLNAWCTTADRYEVPGAVFVQCWKLGGSVSLGNPIPADVSFFLFVAR